MDHKFCVECGARISLDARFCRACGRRQPEIIIPPDLLNDSVPKSSASEYEKTTISELSSGEINNNSVDVEIPKETENISDTSENDSDIFETSETSSVKTEPIDYSNEEKRTEEVFQSSEPKSVPDYRSYLNNGEQQPQRIDEIPEPKKTSGIHPGYILLIGCALFFVAFLVWAIFVTNKISMTHQSKNKSSSSISVVKPTTPSSSYGSEIESSSRSSGSEYSGVGGKVDDYIKGGDYVVGETIAPGTYIFIAEDISYGNDSEEEYSFPSFYAGLYKDQNEEERIHAGWYQNSTYMKIEKDQNLHFSWAKAYPVDSFEGENDPFKHPGMFLVGKDLAPGEYKFKLLTDQGYENYSIYDNIDEVMTDDGFTNRVYNFESDEKITLNEGQYILLEWCCLKK